MYKNITVVILFVYMKDSLWRLISNKFCDDFSELIFYPFGTDIWIYDEEQRLWVFIYENNGTLSYNSGYLNHFFRVFSLKDTEYQKFLKSWFIKNFEIHVLRIQRRNTAYDLMLDGIIGSEKYTWDIKKRYGYSYSVVKKFLDLDKPQKKYVKIKEYFKLPYNSQA
jgi:hypothetical protein